MESLKIGNTDVLLDDHGNGKGKIIISDTLHGYDMSYFWGAMGKTTTLRDFIKEIDSGYFINKLSPRFEGDFDAKKTFRNLRKFIREEMCLNWYDHMEFQKDMREKLNEFQNSCGSGDEFVHVFSHFMKHTLDYTLIYGRFEMENIKESFIGICEPWHFIETKQPHVDKWLGELHKKLKKIL